MLKTQSRTDVVKDKASDVAASAGDTFSAVKDAVSAIGGVVAEKAQAAKDVAADQASTAKEAAAPHLEAAADKAADKAAAVKGAVADKTADANFAGITKDQAHSMFSEQWMPKIQEAIAAATAAAGAQATNAYAALPTQAQGYVEQVAPTARKLRRKKKGKGLILVGLALAAGAAVLLYKDQQEKKKRAAIAATPVVEPVAPTDPVAPVTTDASDEVGKHATR